MGLRVERRQWGMIAAATLALTAADQWFSVGMGVAAEHLSVAYALEEGLDETLLFGGLASRCLFLLEAVVCAPLFEEMLFRGLLFVLLRRRFGMWPSALLSGGLFALVHLYSIVGFVVVFASGVLYAIAFEWTRSLWPSILAHALSNLFYTLTFLLFYVM